MEGLYLMSHMSDLSKINKSVEKLIVDYHEDDRAQRILNLFQYDGSIFQTKVLEL